MSENWLHSRTFTQGMVNGMPWGQSSYNAPWLLQNCGIDAGRIVTRRGHTKEQEETGYPILGHSRKSSTDYAIIKSGNTALMGKFSGGAFAQKNVYSTGTVAVSTNTVTFTGAADMDILLQQGTKSMFRYIYTGSTYSDWLAIASVDSATQITVVGAPGNNTGAAYQIALGGSGVSYGDVIQMGERYALGVAGDALMVYDHVADKSWQAGIPQPNAPSGTFAGTSPDANWYGYAVSLFDPKSGQFSSRLSPRLVRQATATNYVIDISAKYVLNQVLWALGFSAKTMVLWRTLGQASEANAGTATLYFLTSKPIVDNEAKFVDTAYDSNVNTSMPWAAGTYGIAVTKTPVGTFRAGELATGYVGYACAYKLPTGEVGPTSVRYVANKATATHVIQLTMPADTWYTDGVMLFKTEIQATAKEALDAQMYYVTSLGGGDTFTDNGDDDNINYLQLAPLDVMPWDIGRTAKKLAYWNSRAVAYGSGNSVAISGLPQGGSDIGAGYGSGLDEPNCWAMFYNCGSSDEDVLGCAVVNQRLFAMTQSATYVLDNSDPLADKWYFSRIVSGYGCSQVGMSVGGLLGAYSVTKDPDGKTRIVRVSPDGNVSVANFLQKTIDSVTAWYCMKAYGGRIYISTDQGIIVIEEITMNSRLDTGITARCMSVNNGVLYAGCADGKVYSLYSKALGTAGDEGAYTWTMQTGAFAPGAYVHPANFNKLWARWENTAGSSASATAKISSNGYASYVQAKAGGDWSQTITVTASSNDYIQDYPVELLAEGTVMGLQISGTGGYGKLSLCGCGMQTGLPKIKQIGTT